MSGKTSSRPQIPFDPESEIEQRHIDRLIDYLKQFITLSTGSIILQTAFLEKIFPHPKWKGLIAASLISLTACLISAVGIYTALLTGHPANGVITRRTLSLG